MGNTVQNKDIFGRDLLKGDIIKDAEALLRVLDEIEKQFIEIAKAKQKALNTEDQKTIQSVQRTRTAIKELNEVERVSSKLKKDKIRLNDRLVALRSKEGKQNEELKLQIREQTRLTKQLVNENKKIVGSYQAISNRLNRLRGEYKNLAASERGASKEAKIMLREINKLDTQLKKIDKTVGQSQRNVGNYQSAWQGVGNTFRSGLGTLGIVSGIALVAGAVRNIIGIFTGFEKANSKLESVLGGTGEEMELLKDQAQSLGSITAFTATEVTGLQIAFAKLGFPTDAIQQMTKSTLDAAAAMGSGLEETATLTGATLKAFNLDAREAARVNDVLAKATSSSALDFQKLNNSMATVAPVANAFGFSLEETTALLGKLSDAGFDASSGATATRNILLNLADANGKLAKTIGKPVKSLPELVKALKDLEAQGINLGQALELTDKRSVAAFSTFLEGSDAVLELSDSLEQAAGTAQEMADIQLDNVIGDITIMTSAWEGFVLSVENGDGVISKTFRNIIQGITMVLTGFRRLNQEFSENLQEDLDVANSKVQEEVNRSLKRSVDSFKKSQAAEIAIFQQAVDDKKITQEVFEERKIRSDQKIAAFEKAAAKDVIKALIGLEERRRQRLLDDNEFTDITIENADRILESNRETFLGIETSARTRKRAEASAIEITNDRIKKLKQLLNAHVDVKEEIEKESTLEIKGDKKKKKEKRALTGLLEKQAKLVKDIRVEIQRATKEEEILRLRIELGVEREELERLRRIVRSTLEEIDKIERDLIEDSSERRIAQEIAKSEKLVEKIESNSLIETSVKERLIKAENDRLAKFINKEEIKIGKEQIKRQSDLSKAEIEQRRTGFKTEKAFEEFKAAQFDAIRRKAIEDEIALIEQFGGKGSDVRIAQLNAELEGLHSFADEAENIFIDLVSVIGDLMDEAFEKRIDAIGEALQKTGERVDQLRDKASDSQLASQESLAFEQKRERELEQQRERERKRQERTQAFFTVLSTFQANVSSGSPTPLQDTIRDVGVLRALAQSFGSAFDGMDDTGGRGNIDSKGGKLMVIHPHEQIYSKEDRRDLGFRDREGVKDIVRKYDSGMLHDLMAHDVSNDFMNPGAFVLNGMMGTSEIVSKLDQVEKAVKSIQPIQGSVNIDEVKKVINYTYTKGNNIKKEQSKLFGS